MCTIILDGTKIQTEQDFHKLLSGLLNFGSYYGNNLDALWDRLSTDVERPIQTYGLTLYYQENPWARFLIKSLIFLKELNNKISGLIGVRVLTTC